MTVLVCQSTAVWWICQFYLNVWRVCALLFHCTGSINRAECKLRVYSIIYNTTDTIFLSLFRCRLYIRSFINKPTALKLWDFLEICCLFYLRVFDICVEEIWDCIFFFFSFAICLNSIKVKEAGIEWLCGLLSAHPSNCKLYLSGSLMLEKTWCKDLQIIYKPRRLHVKWWGISFLDVHMLILNKTGKVDQGAMLMP